MSLHIQKSVKIVQRLSLQSLSSQTPRFYSSNKSVETPAAAAVAEEVDTTKDFVIKPNKIKKNPKVFKQIISQKGLSLDDVTSPPTQHHFDPNTYYQTVDKVLSDPILKNRRAIKHIFKPEEAKLLTEGSVNLSGPLVDHPGVKSLIDEDIRSQTETELKKPYRPSGNLVFVTLIRSSNHQIRLVKKAMLQLGLRKIHQTQVHADSPRVRGLIYSGRHLLHVKILPVSEIFPRGIPTDDMLPEELRLKPKVSIMERAISRASNRRATKRDFSAVEQKYSHLRNGL